MPVPETRRRKLLIRTAGVLACLVSLAYLVWRATYTIDWFEPWVSVPLLGLEVHMLVGLALFVFSLWDLDAVEPAAPVDEAPGRLALLIPTYDESVEVLLATVAAAVAVEPAHETWVLDDGRRPEVEALARQLGASYLTRADNVGAKAGNLNHALDHIEADFVGIVDADHVVAADFFRHTLGYFARDPKLALVQTPQCFYNDESFEHEGRGDRAFNEQSVFYRAILPAKNRWNAVFWCGTSSVVRAAALKDVGGVATESVTEDMQTSVRLHRAGWHTVAHNEVLAHGLAATDARQYWLQRHRWSAGAMQVIRIEKPITGPGLSLGQRLAYASTLFAWFDSWRTLAYFVLPFVVIATGQTPVEAELQLFGPVFAAVWAMQFVALRLMARGHYPPLMSLVFEALRMPAVVPATFHLFGHRKLSFDVTPKGRTGDDRHRAEAPPLNRVLLWVTAVAMIWMLLTLLGWTPMQYRHPGSVVASSVFMVANAGLLVAASQRVRSDRFGGERRDSVRFGTELVGTFGGYHCQILDVSMSGARLLLAEDVTDRDGDGNGLLELPRLGLRVGCHIRRTIRRPEGTTVMVRFLDGQPRALMPLVQVLFQGFEGFAVAPVPTPEDEPAAVGEPESLGPPVRIGG